MMPDNNYDNLFDLHPEEAMDTMGSEQDSALLEESALEGRSTFFNASQSLVVTSSQSLNSSLLSIFHP